VIEVSDVHEVDFDTASPTRRVRRWWALALASTLTVTGTAGYAGATVNAMLHPAACLPAAPADPVVLTGHGQVTGKVTFTCATSGQHAADITIALDYSPRPTGNLAVVLQASRHQISPLVFTVSSPCRAGRWSVDVSFNIRPRQDGSSQEIIAFAQSVTTMNAANCRAGP
jgi:hypothetical protein